MPAVVNRRALMAVPSQQKLFRLREILASHSVETSESVKKERFICL